MYFWLVSTQQYLSATAARTNVPSTHHSDRVVEQTLSEDHDVDLLIDPDVLEHVERSHGVHGRDDGGKQQVLLQGQTLSLDFDSGAKVLLIIIRRLAELFNEYIACKWKITSEHMECTLGAGCSLSHKSLHPPDQQMNVNQTRNWEHMSSKCLPTLVSVVSGRSYLTDIHFYHQARASTLKVFFPRLGKSSQNNLITF